MREIKFRVWDKNTNKMHVCGENVHDEISFESKTNKAYYYNLQNGCGSLTENSSYVLMQYTGLKDKNGKETYEGDIVKVENLDLAIIVWNDDRTAWNLKEIGEWYLDSPFLGDNMNLDIEVIGNIYENAELLNN